MSNVPNENILKLRELSEEMCSSNSQNYMLKIKEIIDESQNEIEKKLSVKAKVKCYEAMCSKITILLNSIKK